MNDYQMDNIRSESNVALYINSCIVEKYSGLKGPKLDDTVPVVLVFDD
jgi:hypothetical protein